MILGNWLGHIYKRVWKHILWMVLSRVPFNPVEQIPSDCGSAFLSLIGNCFKRPYGLTRWRI